MSARFYTSLSAMAAATALLLAIPAPMAAQTAKVLKRTPDGHPDIQGYWTNATFTPLERPVELGNKEFFTPAEAEAYEKQRLARENSQSKDDVHYDNVTWQSENYEKTVSNRRTSMIFDPPNGRIPPLTPAAQKRAAETAQMRKLHPSDSAASRSLGERCITWGADGPPMIGSTYNANLQILQTPKSVVVLSEMIHRVRSIPTDGTPHLPAAIHQLGGDSRGHWEGDTLVVDSTNFNSETNFRGPPATTRQDISYSPSLHVVERFTPIDAETIAYRFTVEDPATWTAPWTGELMMRRIEGPIYEYACHEGNYGLENILAGARAEEQKAANKGSR